MVASLKVTKLSRIQFPALSGLALCTAGVVASVIGGGAPALAGAEGAPAANTPDESGRVFVPYKLDFISSTGESSGFSGGAGLPLFLGETEQRIVVVDGVEFGSAEIGIVNDQLHIPSNLASVAGIECGDLFQAASGSICKISVRNYWKEADRIFIELADSGSQTGSSIEPAPELAPASLAFMNYDINLVSNPDGALAAYGSFQPSLRLKENAFDVQTTYFQNVSDGAGRNNTPNNFDITSFSYRREWFEKRIRMVAGRTNSLGHGLVGGEQFDGVSFQRFNSDDVGSVPSAGLRPITGFAEGPGVIQYRVGDKVYKQVPVREGRYEISGDFLGDVPQGGLLEFVGLDGVARELSIPTNLSAQASFYRPGDYSFDIQVGRLNGVDRSRPFAAFGGRYGVSRDISLDLGLALTDAAFAIGGTVSTRLPGALGAANFAAATSRSWTGAGARFASTIDVGYYNRIGQLSLDLSHRQYFNGGYRGLGQSVELNSQSGIIQSSRASLGLPLPLGGKDVSFRLGAERSRFRNAPRESVSLQTDLSRNFGRLGSLSFSGRVGRDQTGQSYSSVTLSWVMSIGSRFGVGLNGTSSKSEGSNRDLRYGASLWGSSGASYGTGSSYQISIDQDERISADANWRGRRGNLTASFSRDPGERPFGNVGIRGGLVMAGGGVIASRSVSDSLLVVRAKELARSDIFIPPDMESRTRFNGAGYGVITDLPSYRKVNLSFDESGLPLGMEIAQGSISGSLRPYRGYVVDVPVKRLQPVRLYPNIPKEAFGRGNAITSDSFAPIELDGSLYFNGWPDEGKPLEVTWQNEKGSFSCFIELPQKPENNPDASVFDLIELRDLECK